MSDSLEQSWTAKAHQLLVGRTIKAVRYLTPRESAGFMWSNSGIVLELDNDTFVIPQRDDEGNGPGALLIGTSRDAETIPVL